MADILFSLFRLKLPDTKGPKYSDDSELGRPLVSAVSRLAGHILPFNKGDGEGSVANRAVPTPTKWPRVESFMRVFACISVNRHTCTRGSCKRRYSGANLTLCALLSRKYRPSLRTSGSASEEQQGYFSPWQTSRDFFFLFNSYFWVCACKRAVETNRGGEPKCFLYLPLLLASF